MILFVYLLDLLLVRLCVLRAARELRKHQLLRGGLQRLLLLLGRHGRVHMLRLGLFLLEGKNINMNMSINTFSGPVKTY